MKLRKCPRCDLNYILNDTDEYCKVCMREVRGEETKEEIELCTACNEAPALPGKDVCLFCLKEMGRGKEAPADAGDSRMNIDADEVVDDEMLPDIEEDIPEDAYQEISSDLSLEEMEEDRDEQEEDDA